MRPGCSNIKRGVVFASARAREGIGDRYNTGYYFGEVGLCTTCLFGEVMKVVSLEELDIGNKTHSLDVTLNKMQEKYLISIDSITTSHSSP